MSLPVGSLLSAAFLIPIAWQVTRRRRTKGSTRGLIAVGILLLLGGVALYPTARISVGKPASLATELTEADAQAILHSLLKNVYRAFDFREEEDVYDKLAISLTGDQLVDIYLQNRRSFAVKQAGGAQAKVQEVEVLAARPKRLEGGSLVYELESRWTAAGTVSHWGHVHVRKNLYEARVTLEPVDGAWKITGLELRNEQRVDPSAPQVAAKAGAQL